MTKKKTCNANIIFRKYLAKDLIGKTSEETIKIFCSLDYNHFYDIAKKYTLTERQISSLIGFKDEYFVEVLINQIIQELGFVKIFYCRKITAGTNAGLVARVIDDREGNKKELRIGGDCVVFDKRIEKPVMIIECKEYIDMIRMKELIGESRIIKDDIEHSTNELRDVNFSVFCEVLELTEDWAYLLEKSDLKHKIDKIFIIRDGKRKDKANKPIEKNLLKFREYISIFLKHIR